MVRESTSYSSHVRDDENYWSDATFYLLEQWYWNRHDRMRIHQRQSSKYSIIDKFFIIIMPIFSFITFSILAVSKIGTNYTDELTTVGTIITGFVTCLGAIYAGFQPKESSRNHKDATMGMIEQCTIIELEVGKDPEERERAVHFLDKLQIEYNHLIQSSPSIDYVDQNSVFQRQRNELSEESKEGICETSTCSETSSDLSSSRHEKKGRGCDQNNVWTMPMDQNVDQTTSFRERCETNYKNRKESNNNSRKIEKYRLRRIDSKGIY
jgi:hypothetical protein